MEWHIVLLKAEIATQKVIESHWTLTHVEGPHSAYRYGVAVPPPDLPPVMDQYSDITEQEAIDATKALLGPEYVASLEQSCLDEVAAKANPTIISGVPWAPASPPTPPAPSPEPAPAPPAPAPPPV
jgi:hypothetical protein